MPRRRGIIFCMPQKPETTFSNRIRPHLKALPNTYFVKVQQVAISGTPDFLMCVHGLFVALELKRDGKAPVSKLQRYELDRIQKARGYALVVYPENWKKVWEFLLKLSAGENVDEVQLCGLA